MIIHCLFTLWAPYALNQSQKAWHMLLVIYDAFSDLHPDKYNL